jgi:hypothetical protein
MSNHPSLYRAQADVQPYNSRALNNLISLGGWNDVISMSRALKLSTLLRQLILGELALA